MTNAEKHKEIFGDFPYYEACPFNSRLCSACEWNKYEAKCTDAFWIADYKEPESQNGQWLLFPKSIGEKAKYWCSECAEAVIEKTEYCPGCGRKML